VSEKIGLIIIDTITSLYRVELGGPDATFTLNRELNGQVASLAEVAKTRRVAVFITSQVRSVFLRKFNRVEPVATRTLKFWSSVVLSLKHTGQKGVLKATRQKHPRHKRPASCYITLEETGILDYG
jgi:RecA/RadA recombinase